MSRSTTQGIKRLEFRKEDVDHYLHYEIFDKIEENTFFRHES
jgi:hypothetical protein